MKEKILNEILETILNYKKFENIRSGIIAKIDYQNNSDKSNYLHFYVGDKELKSINPGLMFLSKKQSYFKTSQEMVVFFIENVFDKHINLNINKTFSKFKISFTDLDVIYKNNLKLLLQETLEEKNSTITKRKI